MFVIPAVGIAGALLGGFTGYYFSGGNDPKKIQEEAKKMLLDSIRKRKEENNERKRKMENINKIKIKDGLDRNKMLFQISNESPNKLLQEIKNKKLKKTEKVDKIITNTSNNILKEAKSKLKSVSERQIADIPPKKVNDECISNEKK